MDQIISALPVIASLIVLEGLLSVDNAMVLAAMVSHLPDKEQKIALRGGLIGAYVLRGVALLFASILVSTPWIRMLGASYLVYLLAKNLGVAGENEEKTKTRSRQKSLWATVVSVQLVDLGFSIDNVIAAVALSNKLWVIIGGVFIGMLAMRFVAGVFVKLMQKYPVLETTAYLLVGYVGIQLLVEEFYHFRVGEMHKFGMIVAIIAVSVAYDRTSFLRKLVGPLVRWLAEGLGKLAQIVDWALAPIAALFRLGKRLFRSDK